jgi:methyl-accepting chemotaxis protein
MVLGGMMQAEPNDTVLDDFAFGERIINYIRWPLIGVLLLFNNFGFTENRSFIMPINGVLLLALLLTGYIQIRLRQGRSFGRAVTFVLAVIQDGLITVGVYLTGLYESHFFIFYYPSLLGFSLAFSLRTSLAYASLVGLAYSTMSWFLTPGVSGDPFAFKILIERWLVLYMIVIIGGLLVHQERRRRQVAVATAAQTAQENERLYHNLNEQMEQWRQVGHEIERTAGQAAALARDLARLADEVGLDCEGINTTIEQVVNRAVGNVEQITAIGQVSDQVVVSARDLANSAVSTGRAADQAQRAVHQATEAVQTLTLRSQAIGDLAAAVRQVADQTNLLAFNASIEAIQAGQKGQRFAVVANQVRQVAERAIYLAREIDELSHEVHQGTRQVLDAMSEIAGMVDQAVSLVQTTSQASQSQKASADTMSRSVDVLEGGAQQTAADIQTVSITVQQQHTALQRIAVLCQELADSAGNLGKLTDVLAG